MRGAHFEHGPHVRDAGRVEAQRLVERRRGLPSRKEGIVTVRGEVYGSADGGQRTTAAHAACREGLDCRLGAGHDEERT